MYIYLYIWQMCASASRLVVRHHCCVKVLFTLFCCVGMVLIFQFSPSIGTEASVSAVLWYRFWKLGSGSHLLIPGFRYKVFRGSFAFVSFWYRNWNLNCSKFLEPKYWRCGSFAIFGFRSALLFSLVCKHSLLHSFTYHQTSRPNTCWQFKGCFYELKI